LIQEIIILSNDGIPLFHHDLTGNLNKDHEYHIIASYFDQICRLAKHGFKESLNCLKLDKSVFYFYTHPISNVHIIFKCIVEIDEKKAKKNLLDHLAMETLDSFVRRYGRELDKFDGNVTRFKEFTEELNIFNDLFREKDSRILQMS
jgi:hypothetical protein